MVSVNRQIFFNIWIILILVNLCSLDEETLHITGSLIPAHTGSISWLDKYLADVTTGRFSTGLAALNLA